MDYFIGIDIGTSSVKTVAFSADGNVLARHAAGYAISHPAPEWSEQDPAEIIEAVVASLHFIGNELNGHHPALVSFSAAMHSILAVGTEGQPLTPCIIWADNRAATIAGNLRLGELANHFYHKTGVPIHAMSPFCKLVWWRENQSAIFSAAHKFIGIKEFLFYHLAGKYLVDTSVASATGLLNIHTLKWDAECLDFAGIAESQLSELVSCYQVEFLQAGTPLTNRLQRFMKTAFVVGGSDGGLANLGSGAMKEGLMAVTVGTSGAVRIITKKVYTDELMRTFCYHLKDDLYFIGGASNNGAIVLQWLKENIFENNESLDCFFELAATVPPGCDQLTFLPYILGERAPLWNSHARGVYFGLGVTHGKAHLVRAAMEAVIFNLYSIGKVLMERVAIHTIFANGGFAGNALWIQMLADTFNVKVMVNHIEESSAWGAVLVGMHALGKIAPGSEIIQGITYEPNLFNHHLYLQGFRKFEKIYDLLKGEFVSPPGSVLHPAVSKLQ